MRKILILLVLALAFSSLAVEPEAKLTDYLQGYMATSADNELLPCYITLRTQLDRATTAQLRLGRTKDEARAAVTSWLKNAAAAEQEGLLRWLSANQTNDSVGAYHPFWISNFVFAELTPDAIREVAQRPEVARITRGADGEGQWIGLGFKAGESAEPLTVYDNGREIAWGVEQVNAPDVWDLGYTGNGAAVVIGDTGQRYTHVDLYSHYDSSISYDYADYDSDPYFQSGEEHGTHCAGSVGSDGTAGTQAGVAPEFTYGAHRLYMYGNHTGELSVWASWEGAVDFGADVVSNSLGWLDSWNPDKPTWRTNAQNTIAAGTTLVIAAGNEGPNPNTLRTPGNVPEIISVGATDSSDTIASFSSRGPTDEWGADDCIKPDVSAPGVNIKSCYVSSDTAYQGGWNGTSMATPHVAGACALLLDADPSLTPEKLKQILEDTALDLGDPGKDNDYGSGRLDVLAAVESLGSPPPDEPDFELDGVTITSDSDSDGLIEPGEAVEVEVTIGNIGEGPGSSTTGTLTCSSPDITITDGDGDFGTIPVGGTASSTFGFNVGSWAEAPESYEFTLTVQSQGFDSQDLFFTLFTPADMIDDDVESGEWYWTHSGDNDQWHIEEYRSHSPTHSWKCGGPGGDDYTNNLNASLYSPPVYVDPSSAELRYWTWYDLQSTHDIGYVEIYNSSDWTLLAEHDGTQNSWMDCALNLTAYADSVVQFRFRFVSDADTTFEGWYVDDIQVNVPEESASWVSIGTKLTSDGVMLTWTADYGFAGFNVYRAAEGDDLSRLRLNAESLRGGTLGAWLDRPEEGDYDYYIEGLKPDGTTVSYGPAEVSYRPSADLALALDRPFPNPTSGRVNFAFTLPEAQDVTLAVFDLAGRRVSTVQTGELAAGRHTLAWEADGASAGVYIIRLEAREGVLTQRFIVAR
ncbi:MAG TPA: S8 family serine peptidase [bacterium]|nr:S8 family serine peptidase [bacterium]